jgi:hypothetical protein
LADSCPSMELTMLWFRDSSATLWPLTQAKHLPKACKTSPLWDELWVGKMRPKANCATSQTHAQCTRV